MARGLSDEDRAIWDRLVRGVRRLHAQAEAAPLPAAPAAPDSRSALTRPSALDNPPARTRQAAIVPATQGRPLPMPADASRLCLRPQARAEPPVRLDLAPTLDQALIAAPVRMDARLHRRLARGRIAPEARIDLHGMTRDQARQALTGFLIAAQARGVRLVLAITGKGRTDADEFAPVVRRPGAIRHDLPHWLNAAPLRALVLDLRPAHRSHGGAGAFYIYLRKAR